MSELGVGTREDANGAPLSVDDAVMWASSISCGTCVPCRTHREPTLCVNRKTYGVNRPTREEPALSGSWAETIVLRKGTTVVKLPEDPSPVPAGTALFDTFFSYRNFDAGLVYDAHSDAGLDVGPLPHDRIAAD